MPAPQPLNYAPPELQPRRWRRRVVKIVVALAIVCTAIIWEPRLYRWGSLIYWEHRALTDGPAPNSLVMDWPSVNTVTCNVFHASTAKYPLERLCPPLPSTAVNMGMHLAVPQFSFIGNIFAGEMRTPGGKAGIAFLDVILSPGFPSWNVSQGAFVPTGWQQSFVVSDTHFYIGSQRLKVFGAQLDPSNPSHLTFDIERNGVRRTVDAWLQNNGQFVILPRS